MNCVDSVVNRPSSKRYDIKTTFKNCLKLLGLFNEKIIGTYLGSLKYKFVVESTAVIAII